MSVQISIIHFAEDNELRFNDVLVDQVKSIRFFTKHPYHLNIIDNQMSLKARKDLDEKLPDVEILRTSGRYNTFPAGVNHAIENMRGGYMFVSHTDMLMGWNWLECLAVNLQSVEVKEGFPCATCPTLLFYPRSPDDTARKYADETRAEGVQVYMEKHKIPYRMWGDLPIAISLPGKVTDNGWRLGGAYMASRRFFDEVGLYDPIINRMNDKSYGIRALMTDCRISESNRVYLHHASALHANSGVYNASYWNKQLPPEKRRPGLGTYSQFKIKWGSKILKKVTNGSLWIELHEVQRRGGGAATRKLIEKYRREGQV